MYVCVFQALEYSTGTMEEDNTEEDLGFQYFEVRELNGRAHTLLSVPKTLPAKLSSGNLACTSNVLNILMADVSGSMMDCWKNIVAGWHDHIKSKLTGTALFVICAVEK